MYLHYCCCWILQGGSTVVGSSCQVIFAVADVNIVSAVVVVVVDDVCAEIEIFVSYHK